MDINETLRDILETLRNILLSCELVSFAMDIHKDIPGNIPMLTKSLRDAPKLKNVFKNVSIVLLQTLFLCSDPLHKVVDLRGEGTGFTIKTHITPHRSLHQGIHALPLCNFWNFGSLAFLSFCKRKWYSWHWAFACSKANFKNELICFVLVISLQSSLF